MQSSGDTRIHHTCGSPGIYQEREWTVTADADVGDDGCPDDPYWYNRRQPRPPST